MTNTNVKTLRMNVNFEGILLDMADDNFSHMINRKTLKESGLQSVNGDLENLWKSLLNSKIKSYEMGKVYLATAKKLAEKIYKTIEIEFNELEWSNLQSLFSIRVSTPKALGEKTFVYSSMGVYKKNVCRYLYQLHVAGKNFVTYVKEADEKRIANKPTTKKGITVTDVTAYLENMSENDRSEFIKKYISSAC